jgi:hypothetical protein
VGQEATYRVKKGLHSKLTTGLLEAIVVDPAIEEMNLNGGEVEVVVVVVFNGRRSGLSTYLSLYRAKAAKE